MFGVLKKIFVFAGSKRSLLKRAMVISFLGAVFAALQFLALMLALDQMIERTAGPIWPIAAVMLVSIVGRTLCS